MTPFDVVLVPFPFSDLTAVKKRPCLVLSAIHPKGLGAHYVVAMMTSSLTRIEFPGDLLLEDWKKAGLPKKTVVRLAKIVTIDASLIRKRIGRIGAQDKQKVQSAFTRLFSELL